MGWSGRPGFVVSRCRFVMVEAGSLRAVVVSQLRRNNFTVGSHSGGPLYLEGSSLSSKVNCFLLSKELMDLVLDFRSLYFAQTR